MTCSDSENIQINKFQLFGPHQGLLHKRHSFANQVNDHINTFYRILVHAYNIFVSQNQPKSDVTLTISLFTDLTPSTC